MFESVMGASMMRIAQEKGLLDFTAYDLRDWTHDRHRTTDDDPYGGGVGLVMKCGPIFEAYQDITNIYLGIEPDSTSGNEQPRTGPAPRHANGVKPKTIFLTPCGRRFDDALAKTARYADDAIITDHINPNGFSVKESVCDIMDCYLIDESENDSDVQEVYSGIMKNRLDVTDEEFTEQVFDQCSDEELVNIRFW